MIDGVSYPLDFTYLVDQFGDECVLRVKHFDGDGDKYCKELCSDQSTNPCPLKTVQGVLGLPFATATAYTTTAYRRRQKSADRRLFLRRHMLVSGSVLSKSVVRGCHISAVISETSIRGFGYVAFITAPRIFRTTTEKKHFDRSFLWSYPQK